MGMFCGHKPLVLTPLTAGRASVSRDTSGNIYIAGATLESIAPNVANKSRV